MLVLSRRPSEEIVIDIPPSHEARRIVLTQVRIGPNTSRIGVDAPKDVTIHRAEVLQRINVEPAAA